MKNLIALLLVAGFATSCGSTPAMPDADKMQAEAEAKAAEEKAAAEKAAAEAVKVDVVDTTGAGDAFTTGYLAGYLRGLAPEICARQGAVAASFAVEAVGCQTNLPDHARLEARMQEVFGEL